MSATEFRETETFDEIFGEGIERGEITVIANPGSVEVDGILEGRISLGIAAGLASLTGPGDTVVVSYSVDVADIRGRFDNLFTQVQGQLNQIDNLRTLAGADQGPVATSPNDVINHIREQIGGISNDRLSLNAFGLGFGEVGTSPVVFGFRRDFPTISVPTLGGEVLGTVPGGRIEDLFPPIELSVTIRPVDILQKFVEGPDTYTFEIPASTFIETVDVTEVGCADVRGRIEELDSTASTAINNAQSRLNELQNIESEFERITGVTGASQIADRIQQFSPGILSSIQDRINSENLDTRVSEIEVDPVPGNTTISQTLDDARDIDIPSICDGNLRERLSNPQETGIIGRLEEAQDLSTQINNLKSDLRQIIQEITGRELAEISRPRIACTDTSVTPQSLQNDINSFISDAREFARIREIERTEERFNDLVNRGRNLSQQIENEVEESQCVEEWQSRVQSALSRLQQAGPRREAIIPCGQQFPEIDQAVEDFENTVAQLSAPVAPQRQQEIANRGLDLINRIEENVEPGRCREDFVSRVRSASGRLRGLTEQVTVRVAEEQRDRANETLQQLLQQIEQIQVRRAGGFERDSII